MSASIKPSYIGWLVLVALIGLLGLLVGSIRTSGSKPQYFVLLNASGSNRIFDCPDPGRQSQAQLVVNRLIYAARPGNLAIAVVAKHPLWLDCETRGVDATSVFNRVVKLGLQQNSNDLPVPDKLRFGKGSDHAAGLRLINLRRKTSQPIVIVMMSDGENEGYLWGKVEEEVQALFKGGPTRFLGLGLSQRIIDLDRQLTVLERWREALHRLATCDLAVDQGGATGYYLSSGFEFPHRLLAWFPQEVSGHGR